LCSGAADAIWIASERNSIAGLVLLDGYSYKTMNAVFRHYADRIMSPDSRFRASRRLTEKIFFAQAVEEQTDLLDVGDWMDHADFRRRYLGVLRRNTKMLTVFSGGQTEYNTLANWPPICPNRIISKIFGKYSSLILIIRIRTRSIDVV
jgi:hypothetical protein